MSKVTSPVDFFGMEPGTSGNLIHWDKLLSYFTLLEKETDKLKMVALGQASSGALFVALFISSPDNLARLESYREITHKLADPRSFSKQEIEALADEGKAVLLTTGSLHGHEPGAVQMSPVLVYRLLTDNSENIKNILENVIYIMIPSATPDGQIIWSEWCEQVYGTPFEGFQAPKPHNRLMGSSNNRDGVTANCPETQYIHELMFRRWHVSAYVDYHQTVFNSPRMFTPVFSGVVNPAFSPLVIREQQLYGTAMALRCEEEDMPDFGLEAEEIGYYTPDYMAQLAPFHNIPGLLVETGDVRVATDVYLHPEQFACNGRTPTCNNPRLWEGGWWTLKDIIRRECSSILSILELLADRRKKVLLNTARMALRQTKRGADDNIHAFLIPPTQPDKTEALHLLNILHDHKVEMYCTKEELVLNDRYTYPTGTIVIPMAQPKYALICSLLKKENVPSIVGNTRRGNGEWRTISRACACLPEVMNVTVVPTTDTITVQLSEYHPESHLMATSLSENLSGNGDYRIANRLLAQHKPLFIHHNGLLTEKQPNSGYRLQPLRTGVLMLSQFMDPTQAHACNDACCTGMVLEQFQFPSRFVLDREIRHGIPKDIDILIFSNIPVNRLTEGDTPQPEYPVEFTSGLGTNGKQHLIEFVRKGGRLIAWGESCTYAIDIFGLNIQEPAKVLSPKEFSTQLSTLNINLYDDVLTLGMERKTKALISTHPTFLVSDIPHSAQYRCVARFPKTALLSCGLLEGEEHLLNRPCIIKPPYGKGEIILYGFDPAFRGLTTSTYKLLFNALYCHEEI